VAGCDVAVAVGAVGEEVEDGAVVPDVVAAIGLPVEHVGDDVGDADPVTEASAKDGKGVGGDVERGDVSVPGSQQVVGQRGAPASDIDDRGCRTGGVGDQARLVAARCSCQETSSSGLVP
jgi:hypothetical protein